MQIDTERELEKLLTLCGAETDADIQSINISAYRWEEKNNCVLVRYGTFMQKFNLLGSDPAELCRLFALGTELVGDFVKVAGGIKFLQAVESFESRSFCFCSENAGRVIQLIKVLAIPCVAVIKEENYDLCGRFQKVIFVGDAHKIPDGKDTRLLLFAEDEKEAERLSRKFCGCYLARVI